MFSVTKDKDLYNFEKTLFVISIFIPVNYFSIKVNDLIRTTGVEK